MRFFLTFACFIRSVCRANQKKSEFLPVSVFRCPVSLLWFGSAFLFTATILKSQLYAQTAVSGLSFEERVFDFGEIMEEKGKVSHPFIFKNTGQEPVVIGKIMSGCGCISYSCSNEPVPPGQKGRITITYNPFYRPGFFSKEITVYSNPHHRVNRIWVKGTVIPYDHPVEEDYPYDFGQGLHFNLKVLAFGKVEPGQSKQVRLRYANDTDRPLTLNFSVEGSDKNIHFTNPGVLSPKERGEMIINYTCSKKISGEILVRIYPVINGKKLVQPLQAKVTGMD